MNGDQLMLDVVETRTDEPLAMYERLRKEGVGRTEAKEKVKTDFPGLWEILADHTSPERGLWGRGIYMIEKELAPDSVGTKRRERKAKAAGDRGYAPTEDICGYLDFLKPQVGDEIVFNLHFFQWKFGKMNDGAWRLALGSKALQDAGWGFEVLDRRGREFRIRVTKRPSERQLYTAEEVEVMVREAADRAAAKAAQEVMTRYQNL